MPWIPETYQSSAAFGEGQLDEPFFGPETPVFSGSSRWKFIGSLKSALLESPIHQTGFHVAVVLDIPIKKPREHINSAPGSFNEAGGSPTALRQQDETPRFKPLFLQLKFQVMNRKKKMKQSKSGLYKGSKLVVSNCVLEFSPTSTRRRWSCVGIFGRFLPVLRQLNHANKKPGWLFYMYLYIYMYIYIYTRDDATPC